MNDVLSFVCGFHIASLQDIECSDVSVIGRQDWDSVNNVSKAKKNANPHINVIAVVIHHTATSTCKTEEECKKIIKDIEKFDLEIMKKRDILMHFFIGGENKTFEGRGWGVEDEAIPGYSSTAINIAFIGNFTSEPVPTKALYIAQNLILCGIKMKQISKAHKVYGHNDLRCTDCPGKNLYALIKKWQAYTKDTSLVPQC
uniref:Peptidoglycan recognition protein family domain-containing protein n=1 Tax=Strigamia maritima TaxID=126957 RepID=T1JL35_STRMM